MNREIQKYFGNNLPEMFDKINQFRGKNLLFDFGKKLVLLKFKDVELEALDPDVFFCGDVRMMSGVSILRAVNPETVEDCRSDHDFGIVKKLYANVEATHRLDFTEDEEFKVFFPNTFMGTDLHLDLIHRLKTGDITNVSGAPIITFEESLIESRLQEVCRPKYYQDVVVPFLKSRPTSIPPMGVTNKWDIFKKAFHRKYNWREEIRSKDIKHGDFIYVASIGSVYLLGAVMDQGELCLSSSTKPSLYFSRNYLEFISWYEALRPKPPAGLKFYESCKYRNFDLPGFDNKPFIFHQIGRGQDCKNSTTSMKPIFITSNTKEAVNHFKTTEFAEFSDLVLEYSERIKMPHPSEKPNGYWFS